MRKRAFSILIGFVLLLQACNMPSSTATPTPVVVDIPTVGPPVELYVETVGDDGNDCLSTTAPCATIWGALGKATGPAEINIGPGTFYTTGIAFTPGSDTVFRGAGMDATTLQSDRTTSIFIVSTAIDVTIESLTIGRAQEGARDTWGLRVQGPSARATLDNVRVTDHIHGVLVSGHNSLTINNSVFERNRNGVENGGTLRIDNTSFTENTSAFANYGSAEVSNSDFSNNGLFDAGSGAGTAAVVNRRSLDLNDVDILDNGVYGLISEDGIVNYVGGQISNNGNIGVWHSGGTFTGEALIISDNGSYGAYAGGRSSGVGVDEFTLTRSAILRNDSAGFRVDDGTATLQNVTISGNTTSSTGGGGVWIAGGSLTILDSTIVRNTGSGVWSQNSGTSLDVERSVIALNSGADCTLGGGIVTTFAAPDTYTCDDSLRASDLGLGSLSEIGGTWVYPLQEGSPLIDAAASVAECPSVDQRGASRPIGSTCDIGAYEMGAALTSATPVTDATPTEVLATIYTPTPVPLDLTFTLNAFCRKGPSIRYHDVTTFTTGDQTQVIGKSELEPRWWLVRVPESDESCWVSDVVVSATDVWASLPAIPTNLPLPETPVYFNDTPTCNNTTRDVKLNWDNTVTGATGYRIYRDGTLLTTQGANIAIYIDTVPYSKTATYDLEAINENGASEKLTTTSLGC